MSTSGTTSATVYQTQRLIDGAFRRAGIVQEKITDEMIEIANDLLYVKLSALANRGIPLWAQQTLLIPMYEGRETVLCPVGVVDMINLNVRSLQRASGTVSSSAGTAASATDGDINTICLAGVNGNIQILFSSATRLTSFGVLPGATATWSYAVETSDDGATWTTAYTATNQSMTDGVWFWFDVEGLTAHLYVRLRGFAGSGPTTLSVREFYVGSVIMEVPLALINRDDYFNLPNKTFLGQPTQYWLDKQRDQQTIRLWPAPRSDFTYWQLVAQAQMYIQDVGSMTQTLDIPQRWYDFATEDLAEGLIREIPDAKYERLPDVQAAKQERWRDAWAGETDRSPSSIVPRIRPYTR